jgi:hypothetical protein
MQKGRNEKMGTLIRKSNWIELIEPKAKSTNIWYTDWLMVELREPAS